MSSTNSTGPSLPSGTIAVDASATSANGIPMAAAPAAPTKQARRATSGERAEKMRCMKSIATMSPIPSAISVAQLIAAPCAGSESWPKSNGPMPSGIVNP